MSHKLDKAQKGYPVHEREFLALYSALRQWHYLLKGPKVTAYTDNFSLRFIQTQPNLTPKQARWAAELSQYDLTIKHIPGATNTAADALSRIACYAYAFPASVEPDRPASPSVSEDLLPHPWQLMPMPHSPVPSESPVIAGSDPSVDPDNWWNDYLEDPYWRNESFDDHMRVRTLPDGRPKYLRVDGKFWRGLQVCVPASRVTAVIASNHATIQAGHWGARKTADILGRTFLIHNALEVVKRHVRSCDVCQRQKLTAIVALASCIHCLCPLTNGNLFPLTG